MAKRIDRIVLMALGAFALFSFYMGAYENEWAAGILAFLSVVLARRFLQGCRWNGRRVKRNKAQKQAEATLLRWAIEGDGMDEARALLKAAYPGEDCGAVAVVARHPHGRPLDAEDVLDAWRKHHGEQRLTLLSTVPAGTEAMNTAAERKYTSIALLDGERLRALLARFPIAGAEEEPREQEHAPAGGGRKRIRVVADRKSVPRHGLLSAMLLAMYFVLGNPLYLAVALVLAMLAGIGLRKAAAPRRLFPEEG